MRTVTSGRKQLNAVGLGCLWAGTALYASLICSGSAWSADPLLTVVPASTRWLPHSGQTRRLPIRPIQATPPRSVPTLCTHGGRVRFRSTGMSRPRISS